MRWNLILFEFICNNQVAVIMKKILILLACVLPLNVMAQDAELKTVKSPQNRVAMLELYTSEGCSSCPPADHFLSTLKQAGISDQQLIPLAFHVTYWDYIGWKDRFAKKQFDQRQRDLAHKNKKNTVYTPQFILLGDDYRSSRTFNEDVKTLVEQKAKVDLELMAIIQPAADNVERVRLNLTTDITNSDVKDVALYFAVIENNLTSNVNEGENEGEQLHHDYVVRQLSGPFFQSKPDDVAKRENIISIQHDWKKDDLSIIAFAENPHTGEVLQAVRLKY